jgi:gas vesicle protein
MPDDALEETESTDTSSNGLAWFCVGAVIGASIALLVTPRSGKESRQYLADRGQAIGDTGRTLIDAGVEIFTHGRQLVEEAADLFERGRKLVRG